MSNSRFARFGSNNPVKSSTASSVLLSSSSLNHPSLSAISQQQTSINHTASAISPITRDAPQLPNNTPNTTNLITHPQLAPTSSNPTLDAVQIPTTTNRSSGSAVIIYPGVGHQVPAPQKSFSRFKQPPKLLSRQSTQPNTMLSTSNIIPAAQSLPAQTESTSITPAIRMHDDTLLHGTPSTQQIPNHSIGGILPKKSPPLTSLSTLEISPSSNQFSHSLQQSGVVGSVTTEVSSDYVSNDSIKNPMPENVSASTVQASKQVNHFRGVANLASRAQNVGKHLQKEQPKEKEKSKIITNIKTETHRAEHQLQYVMTTKKQPSIKDVGVKKDGKDLKSAKNGEKSDKSDKSTDPAKKDQAVDPTKSGKDGGPHLAQGEYQPTLLQHINENRLKHMMLAELDPRYHYNVPLPPHPSNHINSRTMNQQLNSAPDVQKCPNQSTNLQNDLLSSTNQNDPNPPTQMGLAHADFPLPPALTTHTQLSSYWAKQSIYHHNNQYKPYSYATRRHPPPAYGMALYLSTAMCAVENTVLLANRSLALYRIIPEEFSSKLSQLFLLDIETIKQKSNPFLSSYINNYTSNLINSQRNMSCVAKPGELIINSSQTTNPLHKFNLDPTQIPQFGQLEFISSLINSFTAMFNPTRNNLYNLNRLDTFIQHTQAIQPHLKLNHHHINALQQQLYYQQHVLERFGDHPIIWLLLGNQYFNSNNPNHSGNSVWGQNIMELFGIDGKNHLLSRTDALFDPFGMDGDYNGTTLYSWDQNVFGEIIDDDDTIELVDDWQYDHKMHPPLPRQKEKVDDDIWNDDEDYIIRRYQAKSHGNVQTQHNPHIHYYSSTDLSAPSNLNDSLTVDSIPDNLFANDPDHSVGADSGQLDDLNLETSSIASSGATTDSRTSRQSRVVVNNQVANRRRYNHARRLQYWAKNPHITPWLWGGWNEFARQFEAQHSPAEKETKSPSGVILPTSRSNLSSTYSATSSRQGSADSYDDMDDHDDDDQGHSRRRGDIMEFDDMNIDGDMDFDDFPDAAPFREQIRVFGTQEPRTIGAGTMIGGTGLTGQIFKQGLNKTNTIVSSGGSGARPALNSGVHGQRLSISALHNIGTQPIPSRLQSTHSRQPSTIITNRNPQAPFQSVRHPSSTHHYDTPQSTHNASSNPQEPNAIKRFGSFLDMRNFSQAPNTTNLHPSPYANNNNNIPPTTSTSSTAATNTFKSTFNGLGQTNNYKPQILPPPANASIGTKVVRKNGATTLTSRETEYYSKQLLHHISSAGSTAALTPSVSNVNGYNYNNTITSTNTTATMFSAAPGSTSASHQRSFHPFRGRKPSFGGSMGGYSSNFSSSFSIHPQNVLYSATTPSRYQYYFQALGTLLKPDATHRISTFHNNDQPTIKAANLYLPQKGLYPLNNEHSKPLITQPLGNFDFSSGHLSADQLTIHAGTSVGSFYTIDVPTRTILSINNTSSQRRINKIFTPRHDPALLLTGDAEGVVRLYDTRNNRSSGAPIISLPSQGSVVRDIASTSHPFKMLCHFHGDNLKLVDLRYPTQLSNLTMHAPSSVCSLHDGLFICSGDEHDKSIQLWSMYVNDGPLMKFSTPYNIHKLQVDYDQERHSYYDLYTSQFHFNEEFKWKYMGLEAQHYEQLAEVGEFYQGAPLQQQTRGVCGEFARQNDPNRGYYYDLYSDLPSIWNGKQLSCFATYPLSNKLYRYDMMIPFNLYNSISTINHQQSLYEEQIFFNNYYKQRNNMSLNNNNNENNNKSGMNVMGSINSQQSLNNRTSSTQLNNTHHNIPTNTQNNPSIIQTLQTNNNSNNHNTKTITPINQATGQSPGFGPQRTPTSGPLNDFSRLSSHNISNYMLTNNHATNNPSKMSPSTGSVSHANLNCVPPLGLSSLSLNKAKEGMSETASICTTTLTSGGSTLSNWYSDPILFPSLSHEHNKYLYSTPNPQHVIPNIAPLQRNPHVYYGHKEDAVVADFCIAQDFIISIDKNHNLLCLDKNNGHLPQVPGPRTSTWAPNGDIISILPGKNGMFSRPNVNKFQRFGELRLRRFYEKLYEPILQQIKTLRQGQITANKENNSTDNLEKTVLLQHTTESILTLQEQQQQQQQQPPQSPISPQHPPLDTLQLKVNNNTSTSSTNDVPSPAVSLTQDRMIQQIHKQLVDEQYRLNNQNITSTFPSDAPTAPSSSTNHPMTPLYQPNTQYVQPQVHALPSKHIGSVYNNTLTLQDGKQYSTLLRNHANRNSGSTTTTTTTATTTTHQSHHSGMHPAGLFRGAGSISQIFNPPQPNVLSDMKLSHHHNPLTSHNTTTSMRFSSVSPHVSEHLNSSSLSFASPAHTQSYLQHPPTILNGISVNPTSSGLLSTFDNTSQISPPRSAKPAVELTTYNIMHHLLSTQRYLPSTKNSTMGRYQYNLHNSMIQQPSRLYETYNNSIYPTYGGINPQNNANTLSAVNKNPYILSEFHDNSAIVDLTSPHKHQFIEPLSLMDDITIPSSQQQTPVPNMPPNIQLNPPQSFATISDQSAATILDSASSTHSIIPPSSTGQLGIGSLPHHSPILSALSGTSVNSANINHTPTTSTFGDHQPQSAGPHVPIPVHTSPPTIPMIGQSSTIPIGRNQSPTQNRFPNNGKSLHHSPHIGSIHQSPSSTSSLNPPSATFTPRSAQNQNPLPRVPLPDLPAPSVTIFPSSGNESFKLPATPGTSLSLTQNGPQSTTSGSPSLSSASNTSTPVLRPMVSNQPNQFMALAQQHQHKFLLSPNSQLSHQQSSTHSVFSNVFNPIAVQPESSSGGSTPVFGSSNQQGAYNISFLPNHSHHMSSSNYEAASDVFVRPHPVFMTQLVQYKVDDTSLIFVLTNLSRPRQVRQHLDVNARLLSQKEHNEQINEMYGITSLNFDNFDNIHNIKNHPFGIKFIQFNSTWNNIKHRKTPINHFSYFSEISYHNETIQQQNLSKSQLDIFKCLSRPNYCREPMKWDDVVQNELFINHLLLNDITPQIQQLFAEKQRILHDLNNQNNSTANSCITTQPYNVMLEYRLNSLIQQYHQLKRLSTPQKPVQTVIAFEDYILFAFLLATMLSSNGLLHELIALTNAFHNGSFNNSPYLNAIQQFFGQFAPPQSKYEMLDTTTILLSIQQRMSRYPRTLFPQQFIPHHIMSYKYTYIQIYFNQLFKQKEYFLVSFLARLFKTKFITFELPGATLRYSNIIYIFPYIGDEDFREQMLKTKHPIREKKPPITATNPSNALTQAKNSKCDNTDSPALPEGVDTNTVPVTNSIPTESTKDDSVPNSANSSMTMVAPVDSKQPKTSSFLSKKTTTTTANNPTQATFLAHRPNIISVAPNNIIKQSSNLAISNQRSNQNSGSNSISTNHTESNEPHVLTTTGSQSFIVDVQNGSTVLQVKQPQSPTSPSYDEYPSHIRATLITNDQYYKSLAATISPASNSSLFSMKKSARLSRISTHQKQYLLRIQQQQLVLQQWKPHLNDIFTPDQQQDLLQSNINSITKNQSEGPNPKIPSPIDSTQLFLTSRCDYTREMTHILHDPHYVLNNNPLVAVDDFAPYSAADEALYPRPFLCDFVMMMKYFHPYDFNNISPNKSKNAKENKKNINNIPPVYFNFKKNPFQAIVDEQNNTVKAEIKAIMHDLHNYEQREGLHALERQDCQTSVNNICVDQYVPSYYKNYVSVQNELNAIQDKQQEFFQQFQQQSSDTFQAYSDADMFLMDSSQILTDILSDYHQKNIFVNDNHYSPSHIGMDEIMDDINSIIQYDTQQQNMWSDIKHFQ